MITQGTWRQSTVHEKQNTSYYNNNKFINFLQTIFKILCYLNKNNIYYKNLHTLNNYEKFFANTLKWFHNRMYTVLVLRFCQWAIQIKPPSHLNKQTIIDLFIEGIKVLLVTLFMKAVKWIVWNYYQTTLELQTV